MSSSSPRSPPLPVPPPPLPLEIWAVVLKNLDLCGLYLTSLVSTELANLAMHARSQLCLLKHTASQVHTDGIKRFRYPVGMVTFHVPNDIVTIIGSEGYLSAGFLSAADDPSQPLLPGVASLPTTALVPHEFFTRGPLGPSGLCMVPVPGAVLGLADVYFSDSSSDRVYRARCDLRPEALSPWIYDGTAGGFGTGDGQLIDPGDCVVCRGLLFVLEACRVSAFTTPALMFSHHFGTKGSAPGQLHKPSGIAAWDTRGDIFVSDQHRIQVFDFESGALRRGFGRKGDRPGEFRRPGALCIVRDRLVVCEITNKRLQVLDPVCGAPLQLITTITDAPSGMSWPARLGCIHWARRPAALTEDPGDALDEHRRADFLFALGASPSAPLHSFAVCL